ncbi:MAG: DsrE family protein, partial [Chitinophagaceae bacterium]
MKAFIFLICILFSFHFIQAQPVPYNVVFDLTSKDTNNHKSVMRWVQMISAERPDAQLEIVLYGQSLDMIVKDKSVVASELKALANNKNVSVKVCAAAMNRHNIDKSQLLPGITIVPDGIY